MLAVDQRATVIGAVLGAAAVLALVHLTSLDGQLGSNPHLDVGSNEHVSHLEGLLRQLRQDRGKQHQQVLLLNTELEQTRAMIERLETLKQQPNLVHALPASSEQVHAHLGPAPSDEAGALLAGPHVKPDHPTSHSLPVAVAAAPSAGPGPVSGQSQILPRCPAPSGSKLVLDILLSLPDNKTSPAAVTAQRFFEWQGMSRQTDGTIKNTPRSLRYAGLQSSDHYAWAPAGCSLPRMDPTSWAGFAQTLGPRSILFAGDSLMQSQAGELACSLGALDLLQPCGAEAVFPLGARACLLMRDQYSTHTTGWAHVCTKAGGLVMFFGMNWLGDPAEDSAWSWAVGHRQRLMQCLVRADVLVLGTGPWYSSRNLYGTLRGKTLCGSYHLCPDSLLMQIFNKTAVDFFDALSRKIHGSHHSPLVVFRSTTPAHVLCTDYQGKGPKNPPPPTSTDDLQVGQGGCEGDKARLCNQLTDLKKFSWHMYRRYDKAILDLLAKAAGQSAANLKWLDAHPVLAQRPDQHPGIWERGSEDCLHYTIPGMWSTVNHLLALLIEQEQTSTQSQLGPPSCLYYSHLSNTAPVCATDGPTNRQGPHAVSHDANADVSSKSGIPSEGAVSSPSQQHADQLPQCAVGSTTDTAYAQGSWLQTGLTELVCPAWVLRGADPFVRAQRYRMRPLHADDLFWTGKHTWSPDKCTLPHDELWAYDSFAQALGPRTILFVGDSQTANQAAELVCGLARLKLARPCGEQDLSSRTEECVGQVQGLPPKWPARHDWSTACTSLGGLVAYMSMPWLADPVLNSNWTWSEGKGLSLLRCMLDADIVLVGSGMWYSTKSIGGYLPTQTECGRLRGGDEEDISGHCGDSTLHSIFNRTASEFFREVSRNIGGSTLLIVRANAPAHSFCDNYAMKGPVNPPPEVTLQRMRAGGRDITTVCLNDDAGFVRMRNFTVRKGCRDQTNTLPPIVCIIMFQEFGRQSTV
eukprot:gene8067-196_t